VVWTSPLPTKPLPAESIVTLARGCCGREERDSDERSDLESAVHTGFPFFDPNQFEGLQCADWMSVDIRTVSQGATNVG
jgi:hypothetical protein